MSRETYRITITGKALIFQAFLFIICTSGGLTWKVLSENKKWDSLIYPRIRVTGLHLNNSSITEDRSLIKSQYIDLLLKKNISVVANDTVYTFDNTKLIKKYNIESTVDNLPNFGGNFTLYEKSNLMEKGVTQLYKVIFTYDENYISESIKTIENAVNRKPINAQAEKLSNENIKINADSDGYQLNTAKLKEDIEKKLSSKDISNMRIIAPIVETKAAITADKLSGINTDISSFATSFVSSSAARSNNIEISTKLINGKLLMPGEIFSFNDCVGERTKSKGFMVAPVIVGDRIDSGIGGGICQVSTTLYNAILKAGLKPLERTHHSLPVSYVPLGLDATVNWNDVDFKFKNTLTYPIYIDAYTQNKNLYVNIYSDSSLLSKKYVISSSIYKGINSTTVTINSPNLHDGYRVRVTSDTYENEMLVDSKIISDELYPPAETGRTVTK